MQKFRELALKLAQSQSATTWQGWGQSEPGYTPVLLTSGWEEHSETPNPSWDILLVPLEEHHPAQGLSEASPTRGPG